MAVTDHPSEPSSARTVAADRHDADHVNGRDWARTRTSDATTPPPPVADAVAEAVAEAEVEAVRADAEIPALAEDDAAPGALRRPPLLVQGLLAALAGGVLVAAALAGQAALVVGVLVVQVVLGVGALALLEAPAAGGALVVALAAGLAADAVVLVDDGSIDRLPGVVGLGLVVALLHQLVRRGRSRVTESLADTLLVVVVVVAAACLLAQLATEDGEQVLVLALAAAAAALLVGRVGDRLLPRPALTDGATRGWAGLLLALVAGAGASALLSELADLGPLDLRLSTAALLGLCVGAVVVTADLAVDLGAAELRPGRRDARRVGALRPTAALLPYALLGPVALLVGRLVLS